MSPSGEAMLLGALFSATNLELKGTRAMAILDEELDKFPLFNNLRNLSLHCCLRDKGNLSDRFKALGRLLQKSLNLEKLTLQDFWFLGGSETERAKQKTSTCVPLKNQDQVSFQCQKLKLIEIKYNNELRCDHQLFQLMWAFWRNLKKTRIVLTKI
ncbi:hypothetical protein DAI22_04g140166 [Oryza sativa Japonica Group]|nr:hypothetical protein DAI22_04g140166 [Oryza sativa Japonica Group]